MDVFSHLFRQELADLLKEAVRTELEKQFPQKPIPPTAALKAREAAHYLGISRGSFYNLLQVDKELASASIYIGDARVWPIRFLDRWLERRQGAQIKLPEKTIKQSEVHPGAPPVEAR
jgi:hypothetical protein